MKIVAFFRKFQVLNSKICEKGCPKFIYCILQYNKEGERKNKNKN